MTLIKYNIFLILIFSCKISIAQTWVDEFNIGVNFSNTGDYQSALKYFHQAKAKYDNDTLAKDYATLLYSIGYVYSQTEVYDTSLIYLERAFEVYKNLFEKEDTGYQETVNEIGIVKYKLGKYTEASEFFKKNANLTEKIYGRKSKEYIVAVSNLAETYIKLERYEQAEQYYINVLDLQKQIFGKESSEYIATLKKNIDVYISTYNYPKAESLYLEAIQLQQRIAGNKNARYSSLLNSLANLYVNTGNYSKAESLYLEALDIQKKITGSENINYATVLHGLGITYQLMGNLSKSEALLNESIEIIKRTIGKENEDFCSVQIDLGLLYYKYFGNYAKAFDLFSEAMKIQAKIMKVESTEYATSVKIIANVTADMEEYSNAEKLFLLALKIQKKVLGELHPDYAITLNDIANLYVDMNDFSKAEKYYLESLTIAEKIYGKEHREYSISLNNLAFLYNKMGEFAKAEKLFLELINVENLDNINIDQVSPLNNLAFNYYNKNDIDNSCRTYLKVINVYNASLKKNISLSSNLQEKFFLSIQYAYNNFSSFIYQSFFKYDSALIYAYNNELQNKGLVLRSSRHAQNAIIKSGDTTLINTLENFRAIKNRLSQYYSLPNDKRPGDLNQLEADAEQLEKKLVQSSLAYRNLKEQYSLTWKDIQNKLGANEAAIEFISFNYYNKKWTDSVLYGALVLRPGYTEPHFVYLFEQKQLEALLQKQPNTQDSSYLNNLYQYSSIGKFLQQLIWKPLDSLLTGVETVYAAPSGLLHTINFTSLPVTNSMRLGQQYQLHIVGTTGDIVKREEQYLSNTTIHKAWLFGGIDYDKTSNTLAKTKSENNIGFSLVANETTRGSNSSWPFLKSTLYESAGIDSLCRQHKIQAEFISGPFASETALKNISGEPGSCILHLATHGYFFPDKEKKLEDKPLIALNNKQDVFRLADNPLLRSGLIFSGANKSWNNPNYYSDSTDDGILTAYEVSNLDLSGAKLVVLSACETGLGEIKGSEGVFGLQRSFKLAGASNIIMSLWEVPDVQTKELMKLFYENCFKGMTISAALKNAQFTMSEKYPPYYWAAFKLLE